MSRKEHTSCTTHQKQLSPKFSKSCLGLLSAFRKVTVMIRSGAKCGHVGSRVVVQYKFNLTDRASAYLGREKAVPGRQDVEQARALLHLQPPASPPLHHLLHLLTSPTKESRV